MTVDSDGSASNPTSTPHPDPGSLFLTDRQGVGSLPNCRIKQIRRTLVKAVEKVTVGIQRCSDRSVAKSLLEHFRMYPLPNEQGSVAVPEVMKPARASD